MKKYLSVFEMIVRSSFYKVLAVLIAMVIVEVTSLQLYIKEAGSDGIKSLELMVDHSYYVIFLMIAYICISVVLALTGCNIGSVQSYTLQRLRISEKMYFLLQCVYNVFCYIVLWATQLGVLLFTADSFMKNHTADYVSNQTIFLAFHRNNLMHSILPMENWLCWLILLHVILSTGIVTADFSWRQRRGKMGWPLILLLINTAAIFGHGLASIDILVVIVISFAFVMELFFITLFQTEVKTDD